MSPGAMQVRRLVVLETSSFQQPRLDAWGVPSICFRSTVELAIYQGGGELNE